MPKLKGKAQYAVFDQAMRNKIVRLSQLENDLRQAIYHYELKLYYQPIISLSTGRINGFEALIRWQHPTQGLISPIEFIPVAEETGLIVPLGKWVFAEACRQMYAWLVAFPQLSSLTMAVNLSARQFLQPDLVEQINQILRETGLKPSSLKLEITESVVMENFPEAIAMLEQLKNLRIGLSIDDFGTGYSSLGRLHRLSVNTLKIDRSFIRQMGESGENSEIVRAIIVLAHNLGMNVIAEGVETAGQQAKLRELECDEGQGYFFARPLTPQAVEEFLTASQW